MTQSVVSVLYIVGGIAPFSFLRYYPFFHKLRVSPWLFWCIFGCVAALEAFWFTGIEQLGSVLGVTDSGVLRLVFYGVYLLLSCCVIREHPAKHLFVWLVSMIFSSGFMAFAAFIAAFLKFSTPHLAMLLSMLLFLPPFMLLGMRFIKRTVIPLLEQSDPRTAGLITVMLAVIFVMGLVTTNELPTQEITPFALLCVRVLAASGGVIGCLIFKRMIEEQQNNLRLQREQLRQEHLLALSAEQFQSLSRKIEETKRMRHDLKHHLAAVQNYLSQEDYSGLSEYITNEANILPADTFLSFCDNPVVNMILSHYVTLAQEKDISTEVTVKAPQTLPLPDTVLWVLLGNLLENAIEGSTRIAAEKRRIRVKINCREHMMGIAIDNLCNPETLVSTATGFASSKKDGNCGNGLASVSLLAEKHNGMASFDVKGGWFLASVSITI